MPTPTISSYISEPVHENLKHLHHGIKTLAFNPLENILFVGASDQKRLGDQLRPQVFSRLFEPEFSRCAGLVSKDLSGQGGPEIVNYGEAACEMAGKLCSLLHLGGDVFFSGLTSAYNRAIEGPEKNRFTSLMQVTAREEMTDYVRRRSGQKDPLAYVLSPKGCFLGSAVGFFGIRLPDASVLEEEEERHFISCLEESFFVGVSGRGAEHFLNSRGIPCVQMPCALSALPRTCGTELREASQSVDCALRGLSERFSRGWIALEASEVAEELAPDLCRAVAALAESRGWGVALFNASIHREAEAEDRWLELLGGPERAVRLELADIWDLAAVIGHAQLYVGGCLDARIVAMAFGIPRINVQRGDRRVADYCEQWEGAGLDWELRADRSLWRDQMEKAADAPTQNLQCVADRSAEAFYDAIKKAGLSLAAWSQRTAETDPQQASRPGQKVRTPSPQGRRLSGWC